MTRMTRPFAFTFILLCASPLLAACARQDAAFYSIDGDNRNSLSILREIYPWSSGWTVKLVTSNGSQCQRRHALQDVPEENFRIELYQPAGGVFILHQDKNWYVAAMADCRFQQFSEAPPAPGNLLGEFAEREKQFTFVAAGAAGAASAASRD
ncbi:conserved exported protein of unknown function [Sterolibacterium denitrificans]|uniref:Lipoprotein n=1 Tax=Sterolibacterium denitrificans TaxID=157592 RepID=A0A7Z7HPT1_9PROT|nr:hypothetical protein [Sterolibacterium denitrificans]SMB22360.1 conserved exported protein of unknown function [Sterolibacterium denitrificans]